MSLFQTKLHSSKQLLAHPFKKKKRKKEKKNTFSPYHLFSWSMNSKIMGLYDRGHRMS
jgi:hypothetical protein